MCSSINLYIQRYYISTQSATAVLKKKSAHIRNDICAFFYAFAYNPTSECLVIQSLDFFYRSRTRITTSADIIECIYGQLMQIFLTHTYFM